MCLQVYNIFQIRLLFFTHDSSRKHGQVLPLSHGMLKYSTIDDIDEQTVNYIWQKFMLCMIMYLVIIVKLKIT